MWHWVRSRSPLLRQRGMALFCPALRRTFTTPCAATDCSAAPSQSSGVESSRPTKQGILGLLPSEIQEAVPGITLETAIRTFKALHQNGVQSFRDIRSIPSAARAALEEQFDIEVARPRSDHVSADGTRKFTFEMPGGGVVETVFIPDPLRGTVYGFGGAGVMHMRAEECLNVDASSVLMNRLVIPVGGSCVSSQVGCPVGCSFCATGAMGAGRNLSAGEIIAQVVAVRRALLDLTSAPTGRAVTNLVFMGMGEPLYNIRAVSRSLPLLAQAAGNGIGRRRVIISTSGVVPHMHRLREFRVGIAVSLHAVDDATRNELVPINRLWPLAEVLQACRHLRVNAAQRIAFEYVLLRGVNDSEREARALGPLLAGIPALVNIIPFNPWPGSRYTCPSDEQTLQFAQWARESDPNLRVTVRWPRGREIGAACGQLQTTAHRLGRPTVPRTPTAGPVPE